MQHEFWTHGVNVQIEYPDRLAGLGGIGPAEPRRSGWGTLVHQMGDTTNWFHFALSTPVLIQDHPVSLTAIQLRAEIDQNAAIDLIHFRHDNRIIHSQEVHLTNCRVDETFICPPTQVQKSVALCARIHFLVSDTAGMVIFIGAGGRFQSPPAD